MEKPALEMHLQQHLLFVADSVLADPELHAVAE
jgi:hypothetical protein